MEKDLKPIEEMTDEERDSELSAMLESAWNKYTRDDGFFEPFGMRRIELLEPVDIQTDTVRAHLEPGGYFVSFTTEDDPYNLSLWHLRVSDPDEIASIIEGIEADEEGDRSIGLTLEAVSLFKERPITIVDALAWLAARNAETEEERRRILRLAYPNLRFEDEERPKPPKQAEKRRYVKSADTSIPNTPMTKALFHPHSESYFMPAEYWEDGKEISTGHGGSLFMSVRAPKSIDMDAAPASYVMTLREEYWHAKAYSLASKSGLSKISGRALLKSAGITNTYSDSAIKTMDEAYRSIRKLIHTPIFFDATKEKQEGWRKDKPLTLTISESNIIAAKRLDVTLHKDNKEDGPTLDFELVLADPADPGSCFPVATFADERGYVLEIDEKKLLPPRAKMDTRIMAFYVSERIAEKKSEPKLSFDTFFEDMGLSDSTPAEKKKCDRAQAALRTLFDNAKKEGLILKWRYYRKGGKIAGISWERPEKSS